jgi:hypothetical protein
MALAQDNLDAYAVCYTKAVDRLQRVDIIPFVAFVSLLSSVYSSWLLNMSMQQHMHTTRSLHHGCKLSYFVYYNTTLLPVSPRGQAF